MRFGYTFVNNNINVEKQSYELSGKGELYLLWLVYKAIPIFKELPRDMKKIIFSRILSTYMYFLNILCYYDYKKMNMRIFQNGSLIFIGGWDKHGDISIKLNRENMSKLILNNILVLNNKKYPLCINPTFYEVVYYGIVLLYIKIIPKKCIYKQYMIENRNIFSGEKFGIYFKYEKSKIKRIYKRKYRGWQLA